MLYLQRFTYNGFAENTFLLRNEKNECWIVDPGMYDAAEHADFEAALTSQNLQPKGIINTHTHIDHIFGVQALKEQYNIPFLIHEAELPVLDGARGAAMLFGFNIAKKPEPDAFIREGEALMLGDDALEVRLAPGHSPGSVVFYYAPGGWAIGGDVLFAGSIGRSDLPGGNHEQLLESVRTQLFTLPDETIVHPGHGPETTVGAEKRGNPFFR